MIEIKDLNDSRIVTKYICQGIKWYLLFIQAFTVLEAKLDPSVAALIQATDKLKDEIRYHMNVDLCYDQADCLTGVRGNWYMLECLWAYINKISKRQARARRHQVQLKPQAHNQADQSRPYPMEVDDQMISMPSVSDKAVATDEQFSDEDKKLKDLKNVGSEKNTNTKTSKKGVTAVKDKKFGKIEHELEKKKKLEGELDNSIEHLSCLDLAETENSASEGTEINSSEIVIINNTPDDVRSLDFRFGPLKVSVYSGLITMAETDAIVNAANGNLCHYGGIADAIAKAAGVEMERQCDEYVRKYGSVPTTEVMHTCAGGTISEKVKYIMHAVGPMWTSWSENRCPKELTQTFLNCMIYGNDVLKLHSVTMPVISSGKKI
jgi:O-acetyl-ADP-ribose deacetylase (regulator of RNase III)